MRTVAASSNLETLRVQIIMLMIFPVLVLMLMLMRRSNLFSLESFEQEQE